MVVSRYGGRTFDRRVSPRDPRDDAYLAKPLVLDRLPKLTSRVRSTLVGRTWRLATWNAGRWVPIRLDQGDRGACVLFGWSHAVATNPIRRPVSNDQALRWYDIAQSIDEFADTPPEEGTSCRAGAETLRKEGVLSNYVWLRSVSEMIDYVANVSPVVIAVNWRDGMMEPDANGFVHAQGDSVGGHLVCIRGVAPIRRYFRIPNTWGLNWGPIDGECLLPFDDAEDLLADDGEACAGVELPLAA